MDTSALRNRFEQSGSLLIVGKEWEQAAPEKPDSILLKKKGWYEDSKSKYPIALLLIQPSFAYQKLTVIYITT